MKPIRKRQLRTCKVAAHPFVNENFNGKYKCYGILGKGSYGVVYCATPTTPSPYKYVAIKKVKNIFNQRTLAKRMLRELRLLRKLNGCENIVGLLDILPPTSLSRFSSLNIVFEYIDSDLKKAFRKREYWKEKCVAWIVYQILLAVKYMHSARICHRDLKPANILIDRNFCIRICDFGLARSWELNEDQEPDPKCRGRGSFINENPDFTDIMQVQRLRRNPTKYVVTRNYRSPEVILLEQDWQHMGAIDMWSVGCIMAEVMNMVKGNCSVRNRKPIFPGTSAYPLSPPLTKDVPITDKLSRDQLNTIFSIIGTPSEDEIKVFTNPQVKLWLNQYEKYKGENLNLRFHESPPSHVDLLQNLILFDRRRRLTANEALEHPALKCVRKVWREHECEPEVFEFEDLELSLYKLRLLLADEVLLYNADLAYEKWGLKRSESNKKLVRRESFPWNPSEHFEIDVERASGSSATLGCNSLADPDTGSISFLHHKIMLDDDKEAEHEDQILPSVKDCQSLLSCRVSEDSTKHNLLIQKDEVIIMSKVEVSKPGPLDAGEDHSVFHSILKSFGNRDLKHQNGNKSSSKAKTAKTNNSIVKICRPLTDIPENEERDLKTNGSKSVTEISKVLKGVHHRRALGEMDEENVAEYGRQTLPPVKDMKPFVISRVSGQMQDDAKIQRQIHHDYSKWSSRQEKNKSCQQVPARKVRIKNDHKSGMPLNESSLSNFGFIALTDISLPEDKFSSWI